MMVFYIRTTEEVWFPKFSFPNLSKLLMGSHSDKLISLVAKWDDL